MPITYAQLTTDEKDLVVAEALYQREVEHFQHENNRAVYEAMLTNLPVGEWPTHLKQLEGAKSDDLHRRGVVDSAVASEAALYAWRDHVRYLLAGAEQEMVKIEGIHAALETRLPLVRRTAAITAAAAKRNIQ